MIRPISFIHLMTKQENGFLQHYHNPFKANEGDDQDIFSNNLFLLPLQFDIFILPNHIFISKFRKIRFV